MDNRSSSGDTCLADMYPLNLMCEYNMMYLCCMATENNWHDYEGVVVVWYFDLHLPKQSVHITHNVVNSNPTQPRYTRYNIM